MPPRDGSSSRQYTHPKATSGWCLNRKLREQVPQCRPGRCLGFNARFRHHPISVTIWHAMINSGPAKGQLSKLRDLLQAQEKKRGFLVAFEGPDGAGKTTQRKLFKTWLRSVGHEVV